MNINPKIIKSRFEKSFDKYNECAVVQNIMADNLIKQIVSVKKNFDKVLELGSGAGLLTGKLVKSINFKIYYANDLTEKSEKYVKRYISDALFYKGNALKINPSVKFDLVVSNAMFQWLNANETCEKCYNLLDKDGILAFTTFGKENFKEIRELTGLSLDYKTIDEIIEIFSKRFKILYSKESEEVLNFNTPLELLLHMKNTGVNSISSKSWTIKDIKEFSDNFNKKYERAILTYSPMIFIMKRLSA